MSYAQDAIDADAALAEAGQLLTVARYSPTRDPATGDVVKGAAVASGIVPAVEVPITAALVNTFAAMLEPGALVSKTVRAFKVSALLSFKPAPQDEVTLKDGSAWPIVGCTSVEPDGTPIIYTVGVAR